MPEITVASANLAFHWLQAIGDMCFSLAIMWTNFKLLMIETHYKTRIVGVSFFVTVAGWWAWNAFLDFAYSANLTPYDIRHGFTHGFGKDPVWWLVLVASLAALFVLDLAWKSIRRTLVVDGWHPWRHRAPQRIGRNPEELVELDVWQEMQGDPDLRKKVMALAGDRSAGESDEVECK